MVIMAFSKDDTKYWKEYFAKVVIEDLFDFGKFDKGESPDLSGHGIGIEITQAYPAIYQRLDGEYEKYAVACENGDADKAEYHRRKSIACNHLNDVSSCEECRCKYPWTIHQACGRFNPVCEIGGEFFEMRMVHLSAVCQLPNMIRIVCDAFSKKLKKLNDGHYVMFDRMGLFIETSFFTNVDEYVKELFDCMKSVQAEYDKKYDMVFLYGVPGAKLCYMDFANDSLTYYDVDNIKYSRLVSDLFAVECKS